MARDVSGRWGDVGAAGRNSGGISGAAGKNVNPVYKAADKVANAGFPEGKGAVYVKGNTVREYLSDAKVTGKARNIVDNAQRAEREAAGSSPRKSTGKYFSNKLNREYNKPDTPKVPVKRPK